MLSRAAGGAEPGVVGHIYHPVRTIGLVHDLTRENSLVADQRPDWRYPGQPQCLGARARREPAARHQLHADPRPTGLILPEWNEVPLVIVRGNVARAGDGEQGVAWTVLFIEAHRSRQNRLAVTGGRDRRQRGAVE